MMGRSQALAGGARHRHPTFGGSDRMEAGNEGIRDYYLLPGLDPVWRTNSFAEENGIYLDAYRFSSLDFFLGLLARVKLPEAS
jgi:hypothetical protein